MEYDCLFHKHSKLLVVAPGCLVSASRSKTNSALRMDEKILSKLRLVILVLRKLLSSFVRSKRVESSVAASGFQ